jgi:hypothetical protein
MDGSFKDVAFPPRCFSVARTLQPSGHAADNAETRCFMALIERQRITNASAAWRNLSSARQASPGVGTIASIVSALFDRMRVHR